MNNSKSAVLPQTRSITESDLIKSVSTIDYQLTIENHSKRYQKMFNSINRIIEIDLPKIDSHYAESYMVEMVANEISILNSNRIDHTDFESFKLGFHVGSSHIGIHEYNNGKKNDRIAIIRFTNNY